MRLIDESQRNEVGILPVTFTNTCGTNSCRTIMITGFCTVGIVTPREKASCEPTSIRLILISSVFKQQVECMHHNLLSLTHHLSMYSSLFSIHPPQNLSLSLEGERGGGQKGKETAETWRQGEDRSYDGNLHNITNYCSNRRRFADSITIVIQLMLEISSIRALALVSSYTYA